MGSRFTKQVNTRCPEDFSIEELRRLLVDKRRAMHSERLERFHRTGKIAVVALDLEADYKGRAHSQRAQKVIGTATASASRPIPIWLNRGLLGLEIVSILGLIGMIMGGLTTLRKINQESVASFQLPTLTPTPLIMAVVLPEGHTPPDSPGGAQPNIAEIPEHLRPLVKSLANIPIPTPASHQAIRIQIPAIDVEAPVVQGDGWEQLKKGVAQHIGTPNPGEDGNIVFSGHNDVFGEVFRDLDHLKRGDMVIVYTSQRQYTYVVTTTKIVAPTAVEVMAPTTNATLTLISCYPYLVDNQRIIISAVLQTSWR
jgi:sortase A